jgi:hypothetical protein
MNSVRSEPRSHRARLIIETRYVASCPIGCVSGLIAIPVGTVTQELRILRRTGTGTEILGTLPVRFVPMTNKPKR